MLKVDVCLLEKLLRVDILIQPSDTIAVEIFHVNQNIACKGIYYEKVNTHLKNEKNNVLNDKQSKEISKNYLIEII